MERIKTGIQGFDPLVQGGLQPGKSILLSGTPGTGKTIFALQFAHHGAKKYGDRCLYVSFEQTPQDLRSQATQFKWDLAALEEKNLLKLVHIPTTEIRENTSLEIIRMAKRFKATRLVIDSLSALAINSPTTFIKASGVTQYTISRFMYKFIIDMRCLKNTSSVLISQAAPGQLSADNVSEFVVDGIIHLIYESMGGQFSRSLTVRKMRETKNDEDIHPLEISNKGLVVHKLK